MRHSNRHSNAILPHVRCSRIGLIPYQDAVVLQKKLEGARQEGRIDDSLLLLEHPPTYTRGRRSTPDELPMGEAWYRAQGIEVTDTDRGGRVTYHGPGQLVAYPIINLRAYRDDVHAFVRMIERVICKTLADHGVDAGTTDGLTGVWTPERRKIASIGVHVSRGVTTHGFAINVNNDLRPFGWIVPCGIDHCEVSSVARELDREQDLTAFAGDVAVNFGNVFGRELEWAPLPELASPAARETVEA